MTISEWLTNVPSDLRLDREVLLATILHRPRSFLYAYPEYPLSTEAEQACWLLWQRRLSGEPLAYLIGQKEFWGLTLRVNQHTLIPRPETEVLVDAVLTRTQQENCQLLEIGTGSGAIACALAAERPSWQIVATDISYPALKVAASNLEALACRTVDLVAGDGLSMFATNTFDVIVSNPPYIADSDHHLSDLRYEPRLALVADDQGFAMLGSLILLAGHYLKPGGILMLEHGFDQAEQCCRIKIPKNGVRYLETLNDLNGLPRVSVFNMPRD